METEFNSSTSSVTDLKQCLREILEMAETIHRHSTLAERASDALLGLGSTLDLSKKLRCALLSTEGEVDFVKWVEHVLPIIKVAAHHVPKCLDENSKLANDLKIELARADGNSRKFLVTLLEKVNIASAQHHLLFTLILRVNVRFQGGLAKHR